VLSKTAEEQYSDADGRQVRKENDKLITEVVLSFLLVRVLAER